MLQSVKLLVSAKYKLSILSLYSVNLYSLNCQVNFVSNYLGTFYLQYQIMNTKVSSCILLSIKLFYRNVLQCIKEDFFGMSVVTASSRDIKGNTSMSDEEKRKAKAKEAMDERNKIKKQPNKVPFNFSLNLMNRVQWL